MDEMVLPGYATEAESVMAFDAVVASHLSGQFALYQEVPGTLTQPRTGQIDKGVRIDRVLIPKRELLANGWSLGAIGVEAKKTGMKLGPWLAQSMDYMRSTWFVQGIAIQLGAVFLWPCDKQYGPIASVMAHNRVGSASESQWAPIYLQLGEETVLKVSKDGSLTIGDIRSGRKVGSR